MKFLIFFYLHNCKSIYLKSLHIFLFLIDKNLNKILNDENNLPRYLKPDLPEHLINKFASRVAVTIEEIAEEAVNLILPDDFLKLAQEKQKDILGARGQI